jgi:hypothetical protein
LLPDFSQKTVALSRLPAPSKLPRIRILGAVAVEWRYFIKPVITAYYPNDASLPGDVNDQGQIFFLKSIDVTWKFVTFFIVRLR